MTQNFILLSLGMCLLALLTFDISVTAQETTTDPITILDCKKVMGKIAKKTMKTFSACSKEVKANSTKEEFEKKMSCIIKCTIDKMGLLNEAGIVTKESIQGFMNVMIPEDAHEFGHALIEECLSEHATKLDMNQPYCESYGEFAQCMQNIIGEFADKANCSIAALGKRKK